MDRNATATLTITRTLLLAVLAMASSAVAQNTITGASDFSVDSAIDGRLITDLLGGLWVIPEDGGAARPLTPGVADVTQPRWSPLGDTAVFQARDNHRAQIYLLNVDSGESRRLGDPDEYNQHPAWHPDGDRLVFSSERHDSGFDLREMDVATGLSWRLTYTDGDELEPAWSTDGRNLLFIHKTESQWSVVIRWFDGRLQVVDRSSNRLSSPAWRPDGSLVTYLSHGDDGSQIEMAILSNPVLVRPLVDGEAFHDAPVSWIDRQEFLYTADGRIRQRRFDAWSSSNVPFRVTLSDDRPAVVRTPGARELPPQPIHADRFVLRVGRLFDGLQSNYQDGVDIFVNAGLITAIEPRRDEHADGIIVIDMDGFTALPGFIDAYARLPDTVDVNTGPVLLSLGVTTLVTRHPDLMALHAEWSGREMPGPRLLPYTTADDTNTAILPWLVTATGGIADAAHQRKDVERWAGLGVPALADSWRAGASSGAAMLLASASAPAGTTQSGGGSANLTLISGLADGGTPGLQALLASRQSQWLDIPPRISRRFANRRHFDSASSNLVLGSAPNDLPPGLATHAEFLALSASGVDMPFVLKAAGVNAASALGMGLVLGRIAPNSAADIVIVDGDPLARVADLRNVVAVIRNGRFYSAIGLLERVPAASGVE